jgi:tripartite ATP-independent transporter DctM subunit
MSVDPIAVAMLLGSFFFLIFIGVHISFAMIVASLITTVYLHLPILTIIQNLVDGIDGYAFLAIPFFILAGELMASGGISDRLIRLSKALVGWLRGGLAMVNVMASMFFGGISGSATADTSSLGSIMIPMMKKDGYDSDFATTVTMAGSIQGLLIPPSHNMVIFALAAGSVSIGKLFLGGVVPGIFLGLALMVFCYFVSVRRNYPVNQEFSLKKIVIALKESLWALGTVIIVVFGVISGVCTATEAAALAVMYSFVVTFFIYRDLKLREFGKILCSSVRTLSIVFILIAAAGAFGWLISYLRIPRLIAAAILGVTGNKFLILMLINILLLILGTMMGMASIIVIMTPILLPIVAQVGIDPVHFGILMILNCGIGLITPPVGAVLFIGSALSDTSIERLSKAMLPFYAVMAVVLLAVTYIPGITMWLPNWLMP